MQTASNQGLQQQPPPPPQQQPQFVQMQNQSSQMQQQQQPSQPSQPIYQQVPSGATPSAGFNYVTAPSSTANQTKIWDGQIEWTEKVILVLSVLRRRFDQIFVLPLLIGPQQSEHQNDTHISCSDVFVHNRNGRSGYWTVREWSAAIHGTGMAQQDSAADDVQANLGHLDADL